jgi:hypothetical protein
MGRYSGKPKYSGAIVLVVCLINLIMEAMMSNVIGFTVFNKVTGKEMATFPLTIPIGSTIEAYERDGHSVTWGWKEEASE